MKLILQIGVICVQDNYLIKIKKIFIKNLGNIIKKLNLSTIIIGDNKLNQILAETIKKNAGSVLRIKFNKVDVNQDYLSDFILYCNKNNKTILDTIINSCCGIIIIGNPNHLASKLLPDKIKNFVIIDKTTKNIKEYTYKSKLYPIFNSVELGIKTLLYNYFSNNPIKHKNYFEMGIKSRYANYPIGNKGEYLKSANYFLISSLQNISKNNIDKWNSSLANYYNSMGDHCYYHENDFFKAASYYSQAYLKLKGQRETDQYNKELNTFLKSIITECVAFSFERRIDDTDLAIHIGKRAKERYCYAKRYSNEFTKKCYNHTISGLDGWIEYLLAKNEINKGNSQKALNHLTMVILKYKQALKYLPQWKISGFSDNLTVSEREISNLLSKLKIISEGEILDLNQLILLKKQKWRGK